MNLRVGSVDEYQFLMCFKYGAWGANIRRSVIWKPGDLLLLLSNRKVAALAEAVGEPYVSEDILWDNGFFEYRIKLSFIHVLADEDRIPVEGSVKDLLVQSWGRNYGVGILNKLLVKEVIASKLIDLVKDKKNSLQFYTTNIDNLVAGINLQREEENRLLTENAIKEADRKFKASSIIME